MRGIFKQAAFFLSLLLFLASCGGGGGGSSSSGGGGGIPSVPGGVSASAGNEQVTVSWGAVSGATSYNIYWATSSGVLKSTDTKITGAASPHTHIGLTNGTTYYYVVTAVNAAGESAESSEASATPVLAPPPAP